MNTTQDAVRQLVDAAERMSTQAKRTRGQSAYGVRFDVARQQHLDACNWLMANDRYAWKAITSPGTVSTSAARKLLAELDA